MKITVIDGKVVSPTENGCLRLYHGTDAASAESIRTSGVSLESAAEFGGREFWMTTVPTTAWTFATSRIMGGKSCVLSADVSVEAISYCLQEDWASIQMDNYSIMFEPQSFEILNDAMKNLTVSFNISD